MYVPDAFRVDDPAVLHAFMRQYSFATLVTAGDPPVATHLPLMLNDAPAPHGSLLGHVARANVQWQTLTTSRVLAVFSGPHAYVSPTAYGADFAVPTWNYAAVHATGTVRLLERDELRAGLDGLVERHEGSGWTMDWDDARADGMLAAIVGFELVIDRLEGKFKLNQNRPAADREGVIAALQASPHEWERAVADLMRGLPA